MTDDKTESLPRVSRCTTEDLHELLFNSIFLRDFTAESSEGEHLYFEIFYTVTGTIFIAITRVKDQNKEVEIYKIRF